MNETEVKKERAILAGLSAASMEERERSREVTMEELAALVETAGGEPVAFVMQNLPSPNTRSFLGEGKVHEMKELIAANECDLAVFDNELTPSQMRVLGEELGVRVLDRSGLILDICFPGQAGLQALIYMWIGYAAGFTYRIFYDDDIKTPLLFVCLGDLVYSLYIYVVTFMLRGRIHFLFYLRRIIIPELLYTLIITIVIYRVLYWINRQLAKTDKRSIDSLV